MKEIKRGGLRRRIAIGAAGARSGIGLLSSRASGLLLPQKEKQEHNDKALEREAKRFVRELGKLKGAYVKIGQMLALYGEHLLPEPVTNALHTLEAQTTPLDWEFVSRSLGEEQKALSIAKEPIAAASLAQVHAASLADVEKQLCVKIQYPGIADAIEDDFSHVMKMLSLTRWVKSGRQLESLTSELKTHLMREVDYLVELKTAQTVAAFLDGDLRYRVPDYFPQLSSSKVLTMDFVDGYEVTHPKVQALSQQRRNKLATAMLELFFKEALEWGLMQTDPNFGNYRIVIDPDGDDDTLVLLDFGAVHDLDDQFKSALKSTMLAAHSGDLVGTEAGLIGLNCLRKTDSAAVKRSLAEFCQFILEPFSKDLSKVPTHAVDENGLYDWDASRLLKRAGKLGSKGMLIKGFVVPPSEFMLMVRKLTGVFTFVAALNAKTNSCYLLERYAE